MKSTRRSFLAAVGSTGALLTAGCVGRAERTIPSDFEPAAGEWPRDEYDYQNRTVSPTATPPKTEPTDRWSHETAEPVWGVVVGSDLVFAVFGDTSQPSSTVVALDRDSGNERWRMSYSGVLGDVQHVRDRVYAYGDQFHALDAQSGSTVFADTDPDAYFVDLLEVEGTVYLLDDGGTLRGLHADTGEERWKRPTGGTTSMAIRGERLYVNTSTSVEVYGLADAGPFGSEAAPSREASWPVGSRTHDVGITVSGERVYRGSAARGDQRRIPLLAFDAEAGEKAWSKRYGSYVYPPLFLDEKLMTVVRSVGADANDGAVYALDPSDGSRLWSKSVGHRTTEIVGADGVVLVAGPSIAESGGRVHAVDGSSGRRLWSRHVGGGTFSHSLALAREHVFLGDGRGVHAFGPE